MTTFWTVVTTLLYAAAFIACLLWADWGYRQLNLGQRYGLPVGVRLLIVVSVGGLAYSAASQILNGLFSIIRGYGDAWYGGASLVGALCMIACVVWLYRQANQGN